MLGHIVPFQAEGPAEPPGLSLAAQGFEEDGDALAAADAGGGEAKAQMVAGELFEEGDDKAGAGSAQGMAEGDGAAVDVGFVAIGEKCSLENMAHPIVCRALRVAHPANLEYKELTSGKVA